jgi:hypothetical protein
MPLLRGQATVDTLPGGGAARVTVHLDEAPDEAWASAFARALSAGSPEAPGRETFGQQGLVQGAQIVLKGLVTDAIGRANGGPGSDQPQGVGAAAATEHGGPPSRSAAQDVSPDATPGLAAAFNAELLRRS